MDTFNVDDYVEMFDYLRSELDMYSKSLSRLNHEIKILQDKQGFLSQKVEELDRKIEALKAEYGDPVLPVGYPRYDTITNTVNGRKIEVGMKVSLCRDGSNQILTGVVEHNPDANMHYSYLSPPNGQKRLFIGGPARIYITGKHGVLIHNKIGSRKISLSG